MKLQENNDARPDFAESVTTLRQQLKAALASEGPPLEVLEGQSPGTFTVTHPTDVATGIATVIRTSGSTGAPKRTALPAASLKASADLTAALLGHGHWLLALPLHYVAGLAVVSRSVLAGTQLHTLDLRRSFTAQDFAAATTTLRAQVGAREPILTSLVPTQLTRLLDSASGIQALREYRAVLVGGGATPREALSEARRLGIKVVQTYGSAETCGGCVYDGQPLPGVSVAIDSMGRVRLGGPQVAAGYLGDPERTAEHFITSTPRTHGNSGPANQADPLRWYVTDDLGTLHPDGVLKISGRVDDVINTGGIKISASTVQAAVTSLSGVFEAVVVPVPHPEWGHAVGLVYAGTASQEAILTHVKAKVSAAAAPRIVIHAEAIPRLSNHKPDRQAAIHQLSELV